VHSWLHLAVQKSIYITFAAVIKFGCAQVCMRIQEMRSGLPHLRKKLAVGQQNNFFAERRAKEAFIESLSEFIESDEPEVIGCDIEQPMWSVVSFDRVESSGLTYTQAAQLIDELDANGGNGLCIVTDAAASHITR
jgi:hypothetical protein